MFQLASLLLKGSALNFSYEDRVLYPERLTHVEHCHNDRSCWQLREESRWALVSEFCLEKGFMTQILPSLTSWRYK